jgi:hypothetical protein
LLRCLPGVARGGGPSLATRVWRVESELRYGADLWAAGGGSCLATELRRVGARFPISFYTGFHVVELGGEKSLLLWIFAWMD